MVGKTYRLELIAYSILYSMNTPDRKQIELMPTIVYIPFSVGTNQYISRIQKNLSEFGTLVRFIGFKTIFQEVRSLRFSRYDALVMNWAENDILDPITNRVSARATA